MSNALFILFFSISFSYAQDTSFQYDEPIVISENNEELIDEYPYQTSSLLIHRNEAWEKQGTRELTTFLNSLPGVQSPSEGYLSGVTETRIRGSRPEQVEVYLDGIRLNDPISIAGSFNPGYFSLAPIKSLQVRKGPQASNLGSQALAGTLSMTSGREENFISSRIDSVAKNQQTLNLFRKYKNSKISLNLNRTALSTQSFADDPNSSENDDVENFQVSAKLTSSPHKKVNLQTAYHQFLSTSDIDQGEFRDDPNAQAKSQVQAVMMSGEVQWTRIFKQSLHLDRVQTKRRYYDDPDPENLFANRFYFFSESLNLKFSQSVNIGSAQFEHGFNHSIQNGEVDPQNQYLNSFKTPEQNIHTQQINLKIREKNFEINLGSNYLIYSQIKNRFNPHAKLSYYVEGIETLFEGKFASNTGLPSLDQLYNPDYGNPELNSSQANSLEFTMENYFTRNIVTSLSLFRIRGKDLIEWREGGYFNSGRTQTDGLDFSITGEWNQLNIRGSLSFFEKRNIPEERILKNLPQFKGTLNLQYSVSDKWSLSHFIEHQGRGFARSGNKRSPFTLFHQGVEFNPTREWKVDLHLHNILGHKYQSIEGYHSPGRLASLGLTYNFL